MRDDDIIALYWRRDSRAINESDARYGAYCHTVAHNILHCREDEEESVNDTWLAAWNSIPPTRPNSLKAYLGRICRAISISVYRARTAKKRGGGEVPLALEELSEYLPDSTNTERQVEMRELAAAISTFLHAQPQRNAVIFMARYWYVMPIDDIAARLNMNSATVKTILRRTRARLAKQLREEGYV